MVGSYLEYFYMLYKLFWNYIYRFKYTNDYLDKHACFIHVDSTTENWKNVMAIVLYAKENNLTF